jgi:TetR/AcrR family transcriptional repressor of nem operon
VKPLQRIGNYVSECARGLEKYAFRRGCLVGNMEQELGALNERFRHRILPVFEGWSRAMEECLREAQECGQLAADADIGKISKFF